MIMLLPLLPLLLLMMLMMLVGAGKTGRALYRVVCLHWCCW